MAANDKLKRAVEEMNKKAANSEAIFGVHDSTNRVTIKIVDKETKEILKEYPPEKTLDMIAKVWELAGLLVDEKGYEELLWQLEYQVLHLDWTPIPLFRSWFLLTARRRISM